MKRFIARLRGMSAPARLILELSLAASCGALATALLLRAYCGGFTLEGRSLFYCAGELMRMPPALLLTGIIGSACAEDMAR